MRTVEEIVDSRIGKLLYSIDGLDLYQDWEDTFNIRFTKENEQYLLLECGARSPTRHSGYYFKFLCEDGQIWYLFSDPVRFHSYFADCPWF